MLILKKLFLILLLLLSLPEGMARAETTDCSAKAMILYEPRTGTVIAEHNADDCLLIASTTKIMTAMIVLEHASLQEIVRPTPAQVAVEGSSMYLRAGEDYTVEELLYGLLLASGNDAALALAEHTAGSVDAFAALMNAKCAELGLNHTHFTNPHGLDDDAHYSSARDLAVITSAAMEHADFCRIFSTERANVHGTCLVNHNKLLSEYDGCLGGKTGYTKAAGRVLVSCAEREGLRLICVTISDPDDWNDHRRAYDEAFSAYRFLLLPAPEWNTVPVLSGTARQVLISCSRPGVLLRADETFSVSAELPRFVFAPVRSGEPVGRVTVLINGSAAFSEPLLAAAEVQKDPAARLTVRERFQRSWERSCRYGPYTVYPLYY